MEEYIRQSTQTENRSSKNDSRKESSVTGKSQYFVQGTTTHSTKTSSKQEKTYIKEETGKYVKRQTSARVIGKIRKYHGERDWNNNHK